MSPNSEENPTLDTGGLTAQHGEERGRADSSTPVLVTGATGMTGQFVVQELQRRGYAVRVLVREASAAKAPPGAEVATGDLSDFASLYRATRGVAGIVHTACTFTDALVDVAAMGVLLDGWRQGPFIFVSSLDVYGFLQEIPATEETRLSESYGDYGRGKVICERMLAAKAAADGRRDYASLRAPHILGPHPKMNRRFIAPVEAGEALVLPGADAAEWSEYRDAWIDVRDLAWVIAESLEKPVGGPLNVLAGHFTWGELYSQLIDFTGSASTIIYKPRSEFSEEEWQVKQLQAQRWLFDDHRLRQHLGFAPQYQLADTLQAAVRARGGGGI
jgi:nucleoside-diphosphate-sugar epimerase